MEQLFKEPSRGEMTQSTPSAPDCHQHSLNPLQERQEPDNSPPSHWPEKGDPGKTTLLGHCQQGLETDQRGKADRTEQWREKRFLETSRYPFENDEESRKSRQ